MKKLEFTIDPEDASSGDFFQVFEDGTLEFSGNFNDGSFTVICPDCEEAVDLEPDGMCSCPGCQRRLMSPMIALGLI